MEKTAIKPPPSKPKKPDKLPRERLSLPLTPHLTKAIQAISKAYGRPQAQVLADLLVQAVPGLTRNLEALQARYAGEQLKALQGVLGADAAATGMSPEALAPWEV
jgi:hypothetical protein